MASATTTDPHFQAKQAGMNAKQSLYRSAKRGEIADQSFSQPFDSQTQRAILVSIVFLTILSTVLIIISSLAHAKILPLSFSGKIACTAIAGGAIVSDFFVIHFVCRRHAEFAEENYQTQSDDMRGDSDTTI